MEPTGMTIILTVLIAMSFCAVLVMCINCLLGTCHGICKPYCLGYSGSQSGSTESGAAGDQQQTTTPKRAALLQIL